MTTAFLGICDGAVHCFFYKSFRHRARHSHVNCRVNHGLHDHQKVCRSSPGNGGRHVKEFFVVYKDLLAKALQ